MLVETEWRVGTARAGVEGGAICAPGGSAGQRRLGVFGLLLAGVFPGCGPAVEPTNADGAAGELARRDTTIVHEPCDIESGAATSGDANGDGRADVVTVSESGKPVCQWLDLNFDHMGDVWVYYAPNGSVRRRETDFDRDGGIDELTTLDNGVIVTRQRATTLAGRLDTWQYFERGVLTRGERDANGDGVIDQWWEYPKDAKSGCALVHSDTNGDGRPDPGATVDLCANEEATGDTSQAERQGPAFDEPLTESTTEAPAPAPPASVGPASPEQTEAAPEGKPGSSGETHP